MVTLLTPDLEQASENKSSNFFEPRVIATYRLRASEGDSVEHDCYLTFQALQQQCAPDRAPWQRTADKPILFTHADCRIIHAAAFSAVAQL